MTTDAEDRSTWPRNGQRIFRAELLRLIEENGGPEGLDLRGAVFVDGPQEDLLWRDQPIDLSRETLASRVAAYREANGGRSPPWLASSGGINFVGVRLQSGDLVDAELQAANFEGAQLQGTNLCDAKLQGANLEGAQLQEARLEGARLDGAHLERAQLQGLDMYRIASLDGAHWYGALLDHTRIRRESLGPCIGEEKWAHNEETEWRGLEYHYAKEAYLLLKSNLEQTGRYEDASWAYVKEQQMEKMAYYWGWRSYGWQICWASGFFWRWLRNWFYELTTGYGERVYMPVLWAMVVVALFTAIYAAAGNVAAGDVGALKEQPTHSPITALVHSIAAFATIGFNTLEPQGWGARLLTAVEAMLGIGLFALFVFTLGNRMRRS